jgi:hypothetical protein
MSWEQVGNITGPPGPPGPPGGTLVEGTTFVMGELIASGIDGVNKIFSAVNAFAADSLEVYLNGLRQRRGNDYDEITDTDFEFYVAPKASDSISIDYVIATAAAIPIYGETPTGAINGTNKNFATAYAYKPTLLAVFLSGLRLRHPDDYTETGSTTFQLTLAPLTGDSLSVDYFQP